MMQLCFVLFGHKCLVTDGKQTVSVLVNKETHVHCVCIMSHSLPFETELGYTQKKGVASLLNYDVSLGKRKTTPVTKHIAYFFDPRKNSHNC